MVYGRRRFKRSFRSKRKYKKKKKSSYLRRLRDPKINTLVEKAAQRVAKKEISAQATTYVTREVWTRDGSWDVNDIWPDAANSLTINDQAPIVSQFARVGGYLNNELSTEMAGVAPAYPTELPARPYNYRDMFLRLKSLIFDLRFLNTGQEQVEVDLCFFRCPIRKRLVALDGNVPAGQVLNIPQLEWHKPFTSLNTITSQCAKKYKEQAANIVPDRHTLMAHKRFSIEPGRIIDAAGGGAASVNLTKWKRVRLAKYFKGLGKKEKYELVLNTISPDAQNLAGQLADCRYYMSMRATGNLVFHGCSACQFQAGKGTARQVVFDRVAPGAS